MEHDEIAEHQTAQRAPSLGQSTFLRVAFEVLQTRARQWITLAMSFSLFAWASWRPTPERILTASIFTLLVHVPLWWKERGER